MAETVAVVLPPMGESVTEGTVVEWRKHPGDAVSEGETLADVTTDKVDVEIPAPATGVITAIHAEEGATVPVGGLLAEILGGREAVADGDAGPARAEPVAPTVEAVAGPPGVTAPDASAPDVDGGAPAGEAREPAAPAPASGPAPQVVEVRLPAMGESVSEGTVSALPVAVGDTVSVNQTIAEVTTDKVDVEVPAPAAGVITELRVAEGSTIPVGGVIAVLAASNGAGVAVPALAPVPAAGDASAAPPAPGPVLAGTPPPEPAVELTDPGAFRVSPMARRRAALEHVDLAAVHGSGPGGQVRSADVAAALLLRSGALPASPAAATDVAHAPAAGAARPDGPATAPTAPAPTRAQGATPTPHVDAPDGAALAVPTLAAPERTPLRGPAAALAAAMEDSRSIPTATSFRTIEVGLLEARRRQLNDALKASGRDEKVSFTHLIGYAVALAAAEMPEMTAHYDREEDGTGVRVRSGVHLGLAVDTVRKDGSRFLVVPVITRAADRDFQSFRAEYERLVGLARAGRLALDDLQGATIQLTNPGGLGTMASVPRLTRGSGTIIATGSIDHPPGLRGLGPERLREMGVGKVMTLTSTYDHRVIQGAQSGEFLGRIEELLGSGGFYARVFASLGVRLTAPPSVVATPSAPARTLGAGRAAPSHELMAAVSAGQSLVTAYRRFGHLAANLDPLGTTPLGEASLDERRLGLTPDLMRAIPADIFRTYEPGETLADIVPGLRATYCGTIAYQIEHLASHEQRLWLREHIESGWHRRPLAVERRLVILGRLTKVEAMERYLRKAFLGQKTFSLEGLDAMVPALEELVNVAAGDGITRIIVGMAHRGRLATITHVANRTYESVLVAFEQGEQRRLLGQEPDDPTGDVKYHLGADGTYLADNGTPVSVKIVNNPSHLEFVDPVVEGWVRAEQTTRTGPELVVDPHRALAVLIHGDAAFPGQGVVAETLNLSALHGYSVGGTVHVISNNQVGFTTDPVESRSTRYASDLAKGFDIPIIHVNADDVEGCVQAMRLAYEYRRTFSRDVLVDLIGYRRYGHNETDEPAYTQPLMYERIKSHATARELYAARLVADGLITEAQADAQNETAFTRVQQAHQRVKETMAVAEQERGEHGHDRLEVDLEMPTVVGSDVLHGILRQLATVPDGFTINRKLASQLQRRQAAVDAGDVDWATAESLAFGSLLLEGVPIRLSGQDT
ncbi:MAG TPA: multifunctional oxoglutarate decarboxylase/oxoglutarate dehydrogenase thiamine pyrophosphate-binding subunit/dihydrolipoyllysine-residue succinyltransferase subunit, partial [Candidatus Dormibacteraeota bacterium]|nr:multifunctional oxoglutarate decarboxylase/oxoglutarate dehydrogenase thiamine pyrophosphate-binding subunit/dihydrolipoyllysine-residue succinyltransferase subunit [Candidatus Dormibacteraeota bacterium]